MVYAPEEDSFFLESFVGKLAFGKVLDMGTGSGILAIAAAKKDSVSEVLAVDLDKSAVAALKKKRIGKITVIQSDLFSKLDPRLKFDTIIFNPPYLPDDAADKDVALDGGKEGHELVERFLSEAKDHLSERGFILLLFSNRTGKEGKKTIDTILYREGYSHELLGTKSLPFFEELYVYRISRSATKTQGSTKIIFAKGKRGVIYREGNVCIKEKNPDSAVDTIRIEAEILPRLNAVGVGPRFIKFEDGKLFREFVEGKMMRDYLEEENGKRKIIEVFFEILKQCRALDKLGINKQELTNPHKDIIVTSENKPVLIDFERCRFSENPKNVTQFLQFIVKQKAVLEKKGIIIDDKALLALGKDYKDTPSDSFLTSVKKILSEAQAGK